MRQGGEAQQRIRTRVYVDGYNLYYGCLKRTPDKWLDLRALITCILPTLTYEQDGAPIGTRSHVLTLKYFTALILEAFARSIDSIASQRHYHAAL